MEKRKTKIFILAAFLIVNCSRFGGNNCFGQNIGINVTGAVPNPKALLDIDATGMSTKAGLLIPRMTTAERNTITAPIPESLLIYNTTTQCFEAWNQNTLTWVAFGCIGGCAVPTAITASAAPDPICAGSTLTLTGGATGTTSWSWTGPNGFTSALQSPTINNITVAGAGVYSLTASNSCGSATAVNTASVMVNIGGTSSTAPTGININTASFCSGGSSILTVIGGSLGSSSDWFWYANGCGAGLVIGTGSSINVSPTTPTTYYVRAEGPCGDITSCTSSSSVPSATHCYCYMVVPVGGFVNCDPGLDPNTCCGGCSTFVQTGNSGTGGVSSIWATCSGPGSCFYGACGSGCEDGTGAWVQWVRTF